MRRLLVISAPQILLLAVSAGCGMTQEHADYIHQVLDHEPTVFKLPMGQEADDAWARAHHFVNKYCSRKIQYVTDYLIDTDRSVYKIARFPQGNEVEFSVVSFIRGSAGFHDQRFEEEVQRRICARYIRTGQIEHPDLLIYFVPP